VQFAVHLLTHINVSCHTRMRHVTYANVDESCHVWMSQVTYEWVMSQICMRQSHMLPIHVTQTTHTATHCNTMQN
jgi:hypothetical protein